VHHDSIHTVPAAGAAGADGAGTAPGLAHRPTTPPGDGSVGTIGVPVGPTQIWPS
jgi:hypothetical protein